jgi:uncharacterized membrane protein YgdD (TMEM256/DUF423 family)
VALILVGILSERIYNGYVTYAGVLFTAGIIFFSGSLYLIVSLHAMNKAIPKAIGILTPIGGMFFIIAWICMLIGVIKK